MNDRKIPLLLVLASLLGVAQAQARINADARSVQPQINAAVERGLHDVLVSSGLYSSADAGRYLQTLTTEEKVSLLQTLMDENVSMSEGPVLMGRSGL